MIVIRSGAVYTPEGWRNTDVVIDEGIVTGVGSAPRGDTEIDATGCLVGPSFVDLHTHLREPGQTWKEDVASGSRAAAAGGFGALVAMPNTDPPVNSPKIVDQVTTRGEEVGLVDVLVAGAMTAGRAGAAPADLSGMYDSGVRLFTDDGDPVEDTGVLVEVMRIVAGLPGAIVAQHAEDTSRSSGGHLHEGEVARMLGIEGIPAEAETGIVARDLRLVEETGVRYHCQHVSSRLTVDLIAAAKRKGLPVTAEVTPHHLAFDEKAVAGLDTNFKMYPPIRSADDRRALVDALTRGIIDVVATDHAPHTAEEKGVPFEASPRGVIGLETAAAVVWQALSDRDRFFEVLSVTPARIAGLADHGRRVEPGAPANLVVFDPTRRWVATEFRSKSANSPWKGRPLHGAVRATIHRGKPTHHGETAR